MPTATESRTQPPASGLKSLAISAWLPPVLWLGIIVWESFALSSSETSRLLMPILRALFPHVGAEQLAFLHTLARKTGHFSGYAMLSLLLYRAWWLTLLRPIVIMGGFRHPHNLPSSHTSISGWRTLLFFWSARSAAFSLLATIVVAALDEVHQASARNRTGTMRDVLLDSAGSWFMHAFLIAASHARISRRVRSAVRITP